jgi:mediator of RNA polymerase II transcription subunit 25
VVVVEGTAALGPYWSAIAAEYVEKIVRYALRRLSCF